VKGHNGIIGTAGFNNYAKRHRANLGYDLQTEFWNKGYMTEALKTVIDFGFKELGINRIEAEVMQGNATSERVLAKLGFINEGIPATMDVLERQALRHDHVFTFAVGS
jgi:ribosomal-protein-alanine N-acetyltransferase